MPIKRSQAERLIRKFGGARKLASAIGRDWSTVYKWAYPRERQGTGGVIPTGAWPEICEAARELGIDLVVEDYYPGEL